MKIDNTFGIEAKARVLFTYGSEDELLDAIAIIRQQYSHLPILHVGCGSNLLFLGDYDGVVLKSDIRGVRLLKEDSDEVTVEVGAGEVCDEFIGHAISRGWYGMENLSLIPGQVGAAAVQNIGAYGVEIQDVTDHVKGISLTDGTERIWQRDECRYGYRRSIFKEELWGKYAITRVAFRLSKRFVPKLQYGGLVRATEEAGFTKDTLTAEALRKIIIGIRQAKLPDPKLLGNAGSFFKNPIVPAEKADLLLRQFPDMPHYPAEGGTKLAAGWLIEQTGWKGRSLGPAAVHDRQALVIVNKGGATGQDIRKLCQAIQHDVDKRFGIKLETEVNFISTNS